MKVDHAIAVGVHGAHDPLANLEAQILAGDEPQGELKLVRVEIARCAMSCSSHLLANAALNS